jgi:putative restriction endonuclease
MNLYVYPTDWNWFAFLRSQGQLDEVNFWRPGGKQAFTRLKTGELFLFRLGGSRNVIAGGGFFAHFSIAPLLKVWEAFDEKNGTPTYDALVRLIGHHKDLTAESAATSPIGCIILAAPFFWPEDQWIPVPSDYPQSAQQGHRYDSNAGTGKALWEQTVARVSTQHETRLQANDWISQDVWGPLALVRRRTGQGTFRMLVADAYDRRCAVTGERTYPVLEAAHIRGLRHDGIHRIDNGLLVRSDIHKLFDLGYVTVTPAFLFKVSARLKIDWSNGREYYHFDDKPIRPPGDDRFRPAEEFLKWHNDTVFRA